MRGEEEEKGERGERGAGQTKWGEEDREGKTDKSEWPSHSRPF